MSDPKRPPPRIARRLAPLLLALGLGAVLPLAQGQTQPGEVVRIDRTQNKLTLKHGPIAALGLPAMSMSYHVKDPRWLEGLQVGDAVRFDAEKLAGQFTVVRLAPAR